MSETTRERGVASGRAKRFLTPSQKYEIWLQLVRRRSRSPRPRPPSRSTGPRSCGSAGRQGRRAGRVGGVQTRGQSGHRDDELEAAKAEIARLCETVKEMAVKLTLVEGKGGWG